MQEQAAAAFPLSPAPLPRREYHPPEMASCLSLVFPCGKGDEDGVSHQVAKVDLAAIDAGDAVEVLDFHHEPPE